MACGDKKAACRIALLDPVLTLTQPPRITALTGVDAIAHAVETYVTKRRNPGSLVFSREAWRLLAANFPRVLKDPNDLEARSGMQLGACFAGMAIENSMLGSAHALANPLTATYGTVHGQAVGVMLPHVVRFNGRQHNDWYRQLLQSSADILGMPAPSGGAEAMADLLTELIRQAGLAVRLSDVGADPADLDRLAADAARQWTGTFNPIDMSPADFAAVYAQAF
jgi:alcohol dehydrogenase